MMLFLIDEQLSRKLVAWFRSKGHEAVHLEDVLGAGGGDSAIVRYARNRQAIVVSKDADFRDLLQAGELFRPCYGSGPATRPHGLTGLLETEWPRIVEALDRSEAVVELA